MEDNGRECLRTFSSGFVSPNSDFNVHVKVHLMKWEVPAKVWQFYWIKRCGRYRITGISLTQPTAEFWYSDSTRINCFRHDAYIILSTRNVLDPTGNVTIFALLIQFAIQLLGYYHERRQRHQATSLRSFNFQTACPRTAQLIQVRPVFKGCDTRKRIPFWGFAWRSTGPWMCRVVRLYPRGKADRRKCGYGSHVW